MSSCPEHPATLEAMRDCYRPVLIFAPTASDPRLQQQLTELSQHGADLRERNILVVINAEDHQTMAMHGLQTADLGAGENRKLRDRFKINNDSFVILLLGKDGGEKLRQHQIVTVNMLNRKIDAMPMRQAERMAQLPTQP